MQKKLFPKFLVFVFRFVKISSFSPVKEFISINVTVPLMSRQKWFFVLAVHCVFLNFFNKYSNRSYQLIIRCDKKPTVIDDFCL